MGCDEEVTTAELTVPMISERYTDVTGVSSHVSQNHDADGLQRSLFFCLAPKSQPVVDSLRLLSFNVGLLEYRLGGVSIYQNPPFTWRRLEHIPVALRALEVDVVCLQEVYDESQAEFLSETLKLIYPYVGRETSGSMVALHNGLMVLSKFPIEFSAFHSFSNVTLIERVFGSKGVLEVELMVPGAGKVTILNAHLASGAVDPESMSVEETRHKETLEMLEIAALATKRGSTPIIIGDLNASPDHCVMSYECLLNFGWRDCFTAARFGVMKYAPDAAEYPLHAGLKGMLSSWGNIDDVMCSSNEHFTWDPNNPLNRVGPHAGCRGLRCDHVFVPPVEQCSPEFRSFVPSKGDIVFQEPRVLANTNESLPLLIVNALCYFWCGPLRARKSLLVTLSDHHAVVVELSRHPCEEDPN